MLISDLPAQPEHARGPYGSSYLNTIIEYLSSGVSYKVQLQDTRLAMLYLGISDTPQKAEHAQDPDGSSYLNTNS